MVALVETVMKRIRPGRIETAGSSALPRFGPDGTVRIAGDPFYMPGKVMGLPFGLELEGNGTSIRFVGENGDRRTLSPDDGWRVFVVGDSRYASLACLPPERQYEALKETTGDMWRYFVEDFGPDRPPLPDPYWLIIKRIPHPGSDDRSMVPDIARFRIDPGQAEMRRVVTDQVIGLAPGHAVDIRMLTRDVPLIVTDRYLPQTGINTVVLDAPFEEVFQPTFGGRTPERARLPVQMVFRPQEAGYAVTVTRPAYPLPNPTSGLPDWESCSDADRTWIHRGVNGLVILDSLGHTVSIEPVPTAQSDMTVTVPGTACRIIACSATGSMVERKLAELTMEQDGWLSFVSGPDTGTRNSQGRIVYTRVSAPPEKAENGQAAAVPAAGQMSREEAIDVLRTPLPDTASADERTHYAARQAAALRIVFPGMGEKSSEGTGAKTETKQASAPVNPLYVR